MAQPTNLFPQPFADSGDKNIIPVSSATTGAATLQAGFPPITSLPLEAGGVAPTRQDFNGVLYMLSAIACWTQAGGLWTYSATTNYEPPAFVSQNGALYWCKAANGPSGTVKAPASDTTGAYWVMLMDAQGMLNTALLNIATPSTYGTVKASTTAAAGVAPLGDSNGALSGWAATESKVGATRLATSAETQTGTAATIAVTPAGLASRTATADRSGIIEIATTAETATGTDATRAVSPAGLKGSLSTLVPPATAMTYGTVKASTTIAANTVPLATSSGTLDPSWSSSYQLSDTAPIVAGTAAAGTSTTVSRSDHVHPAQVDITGTAAAAQKLATARAINGVNFNGTANISINSCPNKFTVGTAEEGTGEGGEIILTRGASGLPIIIDNNLGTLRVFHNIPGPPIVAQLNLSGPGGWNCNAPLPTTAAEVGQITSKGVSQTFTLPSGGTWEVWADVHNSNSTSIDAYYYIVAGGTTLNAGVAGTRTNWFAKRIQ